MRRLVMFCAALLLAATLAPASAEEGGRDDARPEPTSARPDVTEAPEQSADAAVSPDAPEAGVMSVPLQPGGYTEWSGNMGCND